MSQMRGWRREWISSRTTTKFGRVRKSQLSRRREAIRKRKLQKPDL